MLYDVNVSSNALDRYWWCTLKKLLLQPLLRIDRACVVYRAWYNLLQSICPLLSYATDISVSAQGVMYIGLMPKLFRWEIATTFYIGVTFLKKKNRQTKQSDVNNGGKRLRNIGCMLQMQDNVRFPLVYVPLVALNPLCFCPSYQRMKFFCNFVVSEWQTVVIS